MDTPVKRPASGIWAGFWTLLLVGLGKLKFLLAFLKFGKVLTTGLSMIVTIWAYALISPLPFAIGFVILIFLHELGHLAVLSRYGLQASAPVFIPFVGAMIAMKEMPKNVQMEALVGYGGPLAGALAAYLCFVLFQWTGQELLLRLAHVGFFINLFNLIPLSPLDGGRITAAISKWFWLVGWGMILWWFLAGNTHPILLILLLMGGIKIYQTFWGKPTEEEAAYYQVTPWVRMGIGVAYFVLVLFLAFMSLYTDDLIQ